MILQEAAIQGPVVSEEAPVNLGPVLSGVYPGTQGGPSALPSGPDPCMAVRSWPPTTGHEDTVPLSRHEPCMQGRQGPGAVQCPHLALGLFRK